MQSGVSYKTKQFLFVLIKISIVAGALFFIYTKLIENEQLTLSEFINFLKELDTFSLYNIFVVLILSDLNWGFEVLKWKSLVKNVKRISFISALEQSLAGVTASLITPNRIGDYGAKAIYYPKPLRGKIVLLNLLGHMSQMTITTVFGIIGLIIFVNKYQINIDYFKVGRFVLILVLIFGLFIFGLKKQRFTIKGHSTQQIFEFIRSLPNDAHVYNLGYALIRYLIFSYQYYYLLLMFGVEVNYLNAMVLITSMYFLASVIPTMTFFDVVIKGSVAVFLFNYVEVNELTILSITTIMWLLNFGIPSLFGSYFVLNFKLPKTND